MHHVPQTERMASRRESVSGADCRPRATVLGSAFAGVVEENHNAFRSPGAADLETLRARPKKVDYYRDTYALPAAVPDDAAGRGRGPHAVGGS
jgi:hypothetical protein